MSWLPGALKEYLRYAPTLLTEVVDWKSMSQELATLSRQLLNGTGADHTRSSLAPRLPKRLRFGDAHRTTELKDQEKQELGDLILELYFTQVLGAGPFFLDLRVHKFSQASGDWLWEPGDLWGEFSPAFSRGLRDLYQGFYGEDRVLFQRGLVETGLVHTDWPETDKNEMERLFRAYFGGTAGPVAFSLEHFQKSFQDVFRLMMTKKARLGSDFLLLGMMLVTLYVALEELGRSHDVGPLYRKALSHHSPT